jgi:hypothetical protein
MYCARHYLDLANTHTYFVLVSTQVNLEALSPLRDEVPSSEVIYHLALSEVVVWLPR